MVDSLFCCAARDAILNAVHIVLKNELHLEYLRLELFADVFGQQSGRLEFC